MPQLPQPPDNLMEWLLLIGVLVGAARKWLVNPLLKEIRDHAEEHEDARQTREMVRNELVPNGAEYKLPPELREKPLRQLVITAIARQESHDAYSRATIARLNTERANTGAPPLPLEGG